MLRDQNVLLSSIERIRHKKSDMSNRYCREMKPARWISIDRKILEIRLVTDNRP